jgi:hypothetical protein
MAWRRSRSTRSTAGAVGPDHLLLVLGGDQRLVDAVGGEELAEGRGCPAGVDGPQPPAEQPSRRPQPAAGVDDPPAGPLLLDAGGGQGLADLVVVLDQALDPGVHAVDGRLDAGRLGPQAGDLPGRGGVGGRLVDAAEGDAEQHEHDEELSKLAQGEVPFAWRVCGRARTLSRRLLAGNCRHQFRRASDRDRPELSGNISSGRASGCPPGPDPPGG